MRGIAAIVVMLGHGIDLLVPLPFPHIWLAVDLFFVLSGFVLARVYEPRLERGMRARDFMAQRYLRLYPLFALGMLIGIGSGAVALFTRHGQFTPFDFLAAAISGLLLLPSPTWHSHIELMPLDIPGWSLFFELLVNLVYVASWSRLGRAGAVIWCALSGTALLASYAHGMGFGGSTWPDFVGGFPRVGFSFFAGVLIARWLPRWSVRTDAAWLIPVALVPMLYLQFSNQARTDILVAMVLSPLLVAMGGLIEPVHGTRAMAVLGRASYPIYVLHMPLQSLIFRMRILVPVTRQIGLPTIGIVASCAIVAIALLLERYYDRPVRQSLAKRIGDRRAERLTEAATPL